MKSLLTKALVSLLIVCLLAPFQLFVYDAAVYAMDEQSYPVPDSSFQEIMDQGYTMDDTDLDKVKPYPVNRSQEAKSEIISDLEAFQMIAKSEKSNMLTTATGPVTLPDYTYVETKGDQAPFSVQLDHEVISTVSGSLTVRENEMSLPGRNGLGFTLTRTYDSSASQFDQMVYDDGNTVITPFDEEFFPIGKGWSWNIPYISIGSRYRYIHLGDRGTYKFDTMKNELVDYPWKDLTFSSTETNINGQTAVFVLTNLERKKLYFDSGGRLIQIVDTRGNAINFYYSSYTYGGTLSRITDSIGNSINISYSSSEVVISKGNETIVYYKVNQNGKELLSQVRDSMGRVTTYDYSIRNARFNLNGTNPDYMNPYALLTGVTHPTGAKSVYSYETDPIKRFLSGPLEVNQFYRISSREDQVINSDNSISVSNRKDFTYGGDMGSTYDDIEAFSTTIQDGLGTTEFVNKKDYIDSNIGTVYYNNRIVQTATHPKTSLISKNTTTFTYDMASRNPNPIKTDIIKSVVGNSSVFKTSRSAAYNQYGNVTSSTDVNGTTTIFQYDTNHLLTGVSVPVSTNPVKIQYTEYQRDPNYLNITATRVREGGITGSILRESVNTAYDSFGNATATQILRDSGLYTTMVTEYSPQAPYYGAFPTGQQINTTDAEGKSSIICKKYEYDSTNGRLIAYIDPMNQVTRYNYDPIGRVTDVIHPDNSTLTLRYLDMENQVIRTDETGVVVRTTWNPLGWKTNDGFIENGVYHNKATYEYDQYGRQKNSYDALGKKTMYDYDQWGRQSAITYPDLNTDTVFYDDIANTKTITTPVTGTENYVVKDSYDILGRLIAREETKKVGNTTKTTPLLSYTYDLMGNILTAADANANMTAFRYDVLGQLQSVTNQAPVTAADGKTTLTPQITSFLYNQFGKMTQMTYPDNSNKRHVYDEAGRLIKTIDAKGMQEIFFYDGNSNLIRYLDRKGNRFKNTYSNRNLLVKKEIVDGAWASISGEQPISYTYDVAGRRTMMSDSTGNTKYAYDYTKGVLAAVTFPDGKIINYDYDVNGNRILMNDPFGGKTTYHYDTRNRLDLIGTSSTNDYEVKYEYYLNGMLKQILQKNGVSSNYTYDGLLTNNLVIRKADGSVLQSYGYTYDNNGNQLSKIENGVSHQFTYDQMNRIETSQQFAETYGYDIRGNRSFMSTNNPFERPDAKTSFDPYNQLVNTQTAEGTNIEYKYNGDGLLWERIENGETTRYYWDGSNLAAEARVVGGTAAFKARYIRGRGPVARQDEQGIAYYVQNGHGDVVNLVDATGTTKLNSYEYDIFGNIVSQNETIRQPFKYSGEFWDDSSKLQYLRARWYDPSIGRFISEDTYEGDITNPLSLNLYTYVSNNPLKYSDPSGHQQILEPGSGPGLPTPFGGYAGSSSDKGLISALLALMFPFYSPAPAQEPTIIPQEYPECYDPYISQQGTEFENRAIIIPQSPSIENQMNVDSIPFQDNNMEIITSSKLLRKNMVQAGYTEPGYPNAAHHIVAETSPKAATAQAILAGFGIDINSAENGVFLPTQEGVSSADYHPSLHTDLYFQRVTADLSQASNRTQAIEILDSIRTRLMYGAYPH